MFASCSSVINQSIYCTAWTYFFTVIIKMHFQCVSVLAVAFMALAVQAERLELNWNPEYVSANPDGLYERRVIGVNGQWP